jgi:hypothetical protein
VASGSLPPGTLGLTYTDTNQVFFSPDAAGYGWFGPSAALKDEVFANGTALPGSPAAGREDLLTAVLHEMGHLAGRPDEDGGTGLMGTVLPAGTRRTDGLDAVFRGPN